MFVQSSLFNDNAYKIIVAFISKWQQVKQSGEGAEQRERKKQAAD
jgi:hypothetical protein